MGLNTAKQSTFDTTGNVYYADIPTLIAADPKEREGVVIVGGKDEEGDKGGGTFFYSISYDRANADSILAIDPTGTGEGLGCWVRLIEDKTLSLYWYGSDNSSTENLLSEYGIDGYNVFIVNDPLGGRFEYDSSQLEGNDGVNNFNGWLRVNDSRFTSNIDLNGNLVTNSGIAENDNELPNLAQVTAAIELLKTVIADSTETEHTLTEWFGSKGQDIDVLVNDTFTPMTLDKRFEGLPVDFDTVEDAIEGFPKYKLGSLIRTRGKTTAGDGLGGLYYIKSREEADLAGDEYVNVDSPNFLINDSLPPRVAVFQLNDLRQNYYQQILLTSGQQSVNFAFTTGDASIYITGNSADGRRLFPGIDFNYGSDANTIELTNSFPEGTTIIIETPRVLGNQGYARIIEHIDEATAVSASQGDLINLHVWPL